MFTIKISRSPTPRTWHQQKLTQKPWYIILSKSQYSFQMGRNWRSLINNLDLLPRKIPSILLQHLGANEETNWPRNTPGMEPLQEPCFLGISRHINSSAMSIDSIDYSTYLLFFRFRAFSGDWIDIFLANNFIGRRKAFVANKKYSQRKFGASWVSQFSRQYAIFIKKKPNTLLCNIAVTFE